MPPGLIVPGVLQFGSHTVCGRWCFLGFLLKPSGVSPKEDAYKAVVLNFEMAGALTIFFARWTQTSIQIPIYVRSTKGSPCLDKWSQHCSGVWAGPRKRGNVWAGTNLPHKPLVYQCILLHVWKGPPTSSPSFSALEDNLAQHHACPFVLPLNSLTLAVSGRGGAPKHTGVRNVPRSLIVSFQR